VEDSKSEFRELIQQLKGALQQYNSWLTTEKEVTMNRYLKMLKDRYNYESQTKTLQKALDECKHLGNKHLQQVLEETKQKNSAKGTQDVTTLQIGSSKEQQEKQQLNQIVYQISEIGQEAGLQFFSDSGRLSTFMFKQKFIFQ
jgi:hypothetical protein